MFTPIGIFMAQLRGQGIQTSFWSIKKAAFKGLRAACPVFLMTVIGFGGEVSTPNILWLFSDDHAVQAIGAYGGRFERLNPTPNLDRLAGEGMVFDRAYVGNSICAPSRATLLTGKHSHLHGKVDNAVPFDHDQPQFQKILRQNGYQTAMIGKIHLDGALQGFDYWEVLPRQGRYWDPEFVTEAGKTQYKGRHSSEVIAQRALHWLESGRDPGKPFMLMVHFKAPHRNWEPMKRWQEHYRDVSFPEPENLFDDYAGRGTAARSQDMSIAYTMRLREDLKVTEGSERWKELEEKKLAGKDLVRWKYQTYLRDYMACVSGIDEQIGLLLDYLKQAGLDRNTVVMYSSDQGFYLGEHGWFDKRFMYEESFRMPLIARWPGVTAPGSRNHDLVQNIDFAETFLDLAGIEAPDDMQGLSLLPLLKGETPVDWRSHLYYHYYMYPAYHLVRRHEGVTDGRYKLIRFYGLDIPDGEEWELYDLQNDPGEMNSVYSNPEYEATVHRLKEQLGKLRDQYGVVDEVPYVDPRKKELKLQQQQNQERAQRGRVIRNVNEKANTP
jgi:arylsulfatase A-like enzyme